MAKVVWRPEALGDIDGIIDYLDQFDPDAAERTGNRLLALGESLADFPRRGRPGRDDVREMTTVPPYVLRYRVEGDKVAILSVRHGARLLGND